MGKYELYKSDGGVIELRLPLDITSVIHPVRLQQWANDLEKAYYSFYELTSYMPYRTIIVEAYKPAKYFAYVTEGKNIIHIDCWSLRQDMKKMASRENDWNFCALHEMGHIFDFYRSWRFEAEMMTDFKIAYVLEMNGAGAAPSEFPAGECFYGNNIIKAYEMLGSGLSQKYDIFSCAHRFLKIKEDIGWEPFKQSFRYLHKNNHKYIYLSNVQKFENFIYALSLYSKENVRNYFSTQEWERILEQLKV